VLIVRLKHRRQGRARSFPRSIFSDQYAPFHTKVISVTVRDATHVLDRLLYHESDLRIEEHYTDTSGFTDHVF
jgi:TnpA family transposase